MRTATWMLLAMSGLPAVCFAQAVERDISPPQLQAVLSLPLDQAIKQRALYKEPLRAAYDRQTTLAGKDCADAQGQQPYNICMGHASEQVDKDFAVFYNNLQMLCHDQDQLATLQASEKAWDVYKASAMKATFAAWSDGTGASGFAGEVYLSVVRDRMRELSQIYGLNIAQ